MSWSRTRCAWVLIAVASVVAVAASVAGGARPEGFRDDFGSFDARQWVAIARPFGDGAVDPANVTVGDGFLDIRLPAGRLDGGEMRSTNLYRYGSYSARMRIANAPSSLTAFFLYKRPDFAQEIDIEIYNDSTGRIMFSTYSNGAQTHTMTATLPFDATADYHVYTIDYDSRSVRFLVDGTELQRWSTGVPRSSMYVYANAWFPFWLPGEVPSSDRVTSIDWIEHVGG